MCVCGCSLTSSSLICCRRGWNRSLSQLIQKGGLQLWRRRQYWRRWVGMWQEQVHKQAGVTEEWHYWQQCNSTVTGDKGAPPTPSEPYIAKPVYTPHQFVLVHKTQNSLEYEEFWSKDFCSTMRWVLAWKCQCASWLASHVGSRKDTRK